VTTADRIQSLGYRVWAPTSAATDTRYVGKHRTFGRAALSLQRLLYVARHLGGGRTH